MDECPTALFQHTHTTINHQSSSFYYLFLRNGVVGVPEPRRFCTDRILGVKDAKQPTTEPFCHPPQKSWIEKRKSFSFTLFDCEYLRLTTFTTPAFPQVTKTLLLLLLHTLRRTMKDIEAVANDDASDASIEIEFCDPDEMSLSEIITAAKNGAVTKTSFAPTPPAMVTTTTTTKDPAKSPPQYRKSTMSALDTGDDPFAPREGKTLLWRNVNMILVRTYVVGTRDPISSSHGVEEASPGGQGIQKCGLW
jgi:hypothetical protein